VATPKLRIANLIPETAKSVYHAARLMLVKPRFDRPSMIDLQAFDGFNVAFRKNSADEYVLKDSFSDDIFFPDVPEYMASPDHVIIDVGAHIGTFSLLAASKVPNGKVYAIEACQDTFNVLRINVALNRRDNISVHHLALTDKSGTVTLFYDQGNWGHSVVKALSKHSETVASCSLATFLEQNHIEKCHFMKLNCEGAEFPILLATPSAVLQRFETILVLYHCDLWSKNSEVDLVSRLEASGFSCTMRNREDQRGWLIATNPKR
jgi:FkbM family methyltransferase